MKLSIFSAHAANIRCCCEAECARESCNRPMPLSCLCVFAYCHISSCIGRVEKFDLSVERSGPQTRDSVCCTSMHVNRRAMEKPAGTEAQRRHKIEFPSDLLCLHRAQLLCGQRPTRLRREEFSQRSQLIWMPRSSMDV